MRDDAAEEAAGAGEVAGGDEATADDRTALAFPGLPGPAGEGCRLAAAAGRA